MISSSEHHRIVAQLKHFGCNRREAAIYLQCLRMGPASVQEIANSLKQNRVTVHNAIKQLIIKGFLYETRKGKKRLIAPESPDILYRLLQKKENELQLIKPNLDYITKLLSSVQSSDQSIPTVKFYEGVGGFKKMLEETLSAKGEVLVFTYVAIFSKLIGPSYLENYFQRRSDKNIHTRLVFPPCDFAERVHRKSKEYKIQVRLLPPEYKWKSGIFAWNDIIAMLSFTEGKLTCTLIQNADIASFYRNVILILCGSRLGR